jgi:DNA-binding transcriptional LysR family regulator
MDLNQLRCFVVAAEMLHFGKAARHLEMMPSALGRHVRLLEEDLGTQLLLRTTRNVSLTVEGALFLEEARKLLDQADDLANRFRTRGRSSACTLRVGAIDSAAAGLLPMLLHDFRLARPDVTVHLVEDKTIRMLPRLVSGRLDLAFVRPPEHADRSIEFEFLFYETAVVAVPESHRLAERSKVTIEELANEHLIVPERRSRPHSYDLTIKLFAEAGLPAHIAQIAEEKHTIVNLVAAKLGIAIVPRWTSRLAAPGVRFLPLDGEGKRMMNKLPLAAAWVRGSRDPVRDEMLATVRLGLSTYCALA